MKVNVATSFEKTDLDKVVEQAHKENLSVRDWLRKIALATLAVLQITESKKEKHARKKASSKEKSRSKKKK